MATLMRKDTERLKVFTNGVLSRGAVFSATKGRLSFLSHNFFSLCNLKFPPNPKKTRKTKSPTTMTRNCFDEESGIAGVNTSDDDSSYSGVFDADETVFGSKRTASTADEKDSSSSETPAVGQKESAVVFRLRALVALTILLTAVGVTAAVYLLTSSSQQQLFEEQFAGAATKVLSSFVKIVDDKFSALGSLCMQSSMFVQSQPALSWPRVTIDGFQERSFLARRLSGSVFTRLINIVEEEDRSDWEAYAVQAGPAYIQEGKEDLARRGIDIQALAEGRDGNRRLQGHQEAIAATALNFSTGVADQIYNMDETFTPVVAPSNGPYFVLWQESPTYGLDLTGWDIKDFPAYSPYVKKVLESKQNVLAGMDSTAPGDTTYDGLGFTSHNSFLLSINNGGKLTYYDGSPMSTLFLPVFEDFEAENLKVVAIMLGYFQWSVYFQDLLPPTSPGVDIVLENDCGEVHTYNLVGGADAKYLGAGDLHDRHFDGMQQSAALGDTYAKYSDSGRVQLNQDICAYTLTVYPTKSFEDEYTSNLPVVLVTVISVLVSCR